MKRISALILVCIIFLQLTSYASAKTISYAPYQGYEYNEYGESVPAPISYLCNKVFYSKDLGLAEPLKNPQDMTIHDNYIYILDSGNGRIVKLDSSFKCVQIFDHFETRDGEEKSIVGAQGFALDSSGEFFYIANTEMCEVLKVNQEGTVLLDITRPDKVLLDTQAQFHVTKVAINSKGSLFVLADTINMGAFIFNDEGKFQSFFGANTIIPTGQIIRDYMWKKFMTKEQRNGLERVTPTVFKNFDFDSYGFLYTVSESKEDTAKAGLVRRLNYLGSDVLNKDYIFGDQEWDRAYDNPMYTSFGDVDIDKKGNINLLDTGRGKVFQYSPTGEQIGVFGSYNAQNGGLIMPVAIESMDDTVLVLDSKRQGIVSYRPTKYGALLRDAFSNLNSSQSDKTMSMWQSVLKMNSNSLSAYYGLGMVYDSRGEYGQAMKMFKQAGAHKEYSKSLREYRSTFVNKYFWLIAIAVVGLVVILVMCVNRLKKKAIVVEGTAFSALETKKLFPIYTCFHPADGFDQFKGRKIYSIPIAILLVISWFAIRTIKYFNFGFCFNYDRPQDYQLLIMIGVTIGIFVLGVIANWSVCVLLNGKGSLAEIICIISYSLVPYLISQLICVVLSNVLTLDESIFISLVSAIGIIWSAIVLFVGLQSIHHYTFWSNVGSIILTGVAMVIIFLIIVLFYTLSSQAVNFIHSIFTELSLR